MALHNVRYSSDYHWVQPVPIRGFEANLALLRWFFQHSQVAGNWVKFDYLSKSDGELQAARTAVPDLGTLARDLGSFRTILYHLSIEQRFSPEEIEQIDALILGWSDQAMAVLASYSPGIPAGTSGYVLLTKWAVLGETTMVYLMKKNAHGCGIINTYLKFRSQVDKLQPLMHQMVIGRTNKISCQTAGGVALDIQEQCRVQIMSYFDTLPPWDDGNTLPDFLSTLVPGTTVVDANIAQLRAYKNQRTLHRRVIFDAPASPGSWQEFGTASIVVNDFFSFLMSTPVDNQSQVISRLPLKRDEVAAMGIRMLAIDTENSVEHVSIILEDLNLLSTSINAMYESSIPWTPEHFGCTRESLNQWKIEALTKKKKIEKDLKKMAEDEKSKSEIYIKNLKSRKLPEIKQENWSRFLALWKTEQDNYQTEAQKLSIIRDRMVVPSDKSSTESMESLEAILTFLYNRYGSPNAIMLDTLDELETLGAPSDTKKLEENIVQVAAVLSICEKDAELSPFWSTARTGRVVNTSLSEAMRQKFWGDFEVFKTDSYSSHIANGAETPSDQWEQFFDKEFPVARIKFLSMFLNRELGILRNMGVGTKGKKSGIKPPQQSKLVNSNENWSCVVCGTKHKNDKKTVRPYLSACEVWKTMNFEKQVQTCKTHRFCMVCTMSLDSKGHQGSDGCPRKEQFKCSVCPAPQCYTHCNILCRTQHKAKKAGNPPNGGGGGGRGGGGGGGYGGRRGGRDQNGGDQSGSGGNPSDTTIVPYSGGLPNRSLGTGGFGAKTWSISSNVDWVKTFKTENSERPTWAKGWLANRNHFQPVFLGSLVLPKGTANCLMLSDNGSSIAFCEEDYMAEIGIKCLGQWDGWIETINSCTKVSTPFFKLGIKQKDSIYALFALGCTGLGTRDEIPAGIIHDICVMFNCDPNHVVRDGGKIRVLIGQDSGRLLLRPLTHMCGKEILKFIPEFAKDLSLQTTPASPMLSVAGSIGYGCSMDGNASIFQCKIPRQHYTFDSEPSKLDLEVLKEVQANSTYSVRTATPVSGPPVQTVPDPPGGGDGGGGPPGLSPGSALQVRSTSAPQTVQPPDGKATKGFSIKTLTNKLKSLAMSRRKFLPRFPALAMLLTMSLLAKPATTAGLQPVGSADSSAFSSPGKARYTASTVTEKTGSGDFELSCLSADTSALLTRKLARKIFSLSALSASFNLLVDPTFLVKNNLVSDDPDSKSLLSYLQCDACAERSRRCQGCKWLNSSASVQELAELELIRNCISVKEDPVTHQMFVEASYPFIGDIETLYSSSKSNYSGAIATSSQLFKKLHKVGKAEEFHAEILKSIDENHMKLLTKSEGEEMMKSFHCFSFLNYQLKDSSSSQKCRPVTNSSSNHVSGSVNARTPRGPNLLNNLRTVWENFRLKRFVAVSDLKRCYRCMRTDHNTNRMRLMAYPKEPLNPDNTEFLILYLMRATYGDQICSCLLETILRDVIAPHTKTKLGREILEDGRYVDDIAGGDDNKDILNEAMQDILKTLEKFGFTFKMLLTNFMEWKSDGSSLDGSITPDMVSELVFHHSWFYRSDELINMPKFNVHKKVRGSYAGPDLNMTDIDSLVITKRLASRLMGQAFSIDGSFLSPLKAVFSVFFSQICNLTDVWDDPIEEELACDFRQFLKVLQTELPKMTPSPRCVFPPGYRPAGLDGHSDGSLYLSSWVFYLLSVAETNPKAFASMIVAAAAKVKHHSVVGNEMLGIYLLTESITSYVFNHHRSLFKTLTEPFFIRLGMDSECCLFSLNPLKLNKSILIKNAVRAIHSFCQDLTSKWPHVTIVFYHVRTDENCGDLNSKIPDGLNPCCIMESQMWRNGLTEFLDPSWPPEDRIFLKVEKGNFTWCKTKESQNLPSNCMRCHNVICGESGCRCLVCLPVSGTKIFNTSPVSSLNWPVLLSSLPLLTLEHLQSLLKRRNVKMAIRSLARFLALTLSPDVKAMIGIPSKWYGSHLEDTESVTDHHQISVAEISIIFQKLAFLTLVKSSNAHFPPSNSFSSEKIGNVTLAKMRYSSEGLYQVFETNLIPIISSSHKLLVYRLFQRAHIVGNPTKPSLGSAHLSLSLTCQRFKTGTTAALFSHMRPALAKLVQTCPFCIRVGSSERLFSHSAEDPQVLSLLEIESPVFHCVSVDLFCDVYVLAHSKARGKPSYPITIMIVADLVSKTVCFVVLDGQKTTDVVLGLQQLALRHRLPSLILLDSGPQLRNLPDHQELTKALSDKEVKLIIVPQGHAFANFSERMIKEAKKLLNTLREDSNRSIYRQPQSLLELLGKLQLIESVLSLRPILGHTKDQLQTVLTPRKLTHPYLGGEELNSCAIDILRGVFDPDPIISQLGRTASQTKIWLKDALICYLQDSGIRYQSERSGNDQKKSFTDLKAKVGDVVLFKDSEKRKRFGIIVEILEKNNVTIRSVLNSVVTLRQFHVRVLILLYRPEEWQQDLPKF